MMMILINQHCNYIHLCLTELALFNFVTVTNQTFSLGMSRDVQRLLGVFCYHFVTRIIKHADNQ